MAGMSLGEMKTLLSEYIRAEKACLKNQSYTIKDRTYSRADLATIARYREKLSNDISTIENGGMRIRRFVPRD